MLIFSIDLFDDPCPRCQLNSIHIGLHGNIL